MKRQSTLNTEEKKFLESDQCQLHKLETN